MNAREKALLSLEAPIWELAMVVQIAAELFEGVKSVTRGTAEYRELPECDYEKMQFLVYEMCRRTRSMQIEFEKAIDLGDTAAKAA